MVEDPAIRILIVDDNADARDMYVEFFSLQGFDVLHAGDAMSGLEIARRQKPDVILLDVAMPGMDGFSLLRKLRGDPDAAAAAIPVLTFSASIEQNYAQRATESGATLALTKPMLPDELVPILRETVKARKARTVADASGG